jgi:hypothetical protein
MYSTNYRIGRMGDEGDFEMKREKKQWNPG